jgi:hypothetical protein
MPVNAIPLTSAMEIVVRAGTDAKGNPILATRTYRSVKTTAADEDVLAVGQALAGLQANPVDSIRRVNEVELEPAV